jgi:hypothetical protein
MPSLIPVRSHASTHVCACHAANTPCSGGGGGGGAQPGTMPGILADESDTPAINHLRHVPDVYALGDCCANPDAPLPALAQVPARLHVCMVHTCMHVWPVWACALCARRCCGVDFWGCGAGRFWEQLAARPDSDKHLCSMLTCTPRMRGPPPFGLHPFQSCPCLFCCAGPAFPTPGG